MPPLNFLPCGGEADCTRRPVIPAAGLLADNLHSPDSYRELANELQVI
jgi:hypothetical protein